jgi:hypothetical protein
MGNRQFGDFDYKPIYWEGKEDYHRVEFNQCKLGFINVLNDNGELDMEIGERILNKIGVMENDK